MHVYMAESLCCPCETITTLPISYISKQNKKEFILQNKKLKKKTINAGVHVEKREPLTLLVGLWKTIWYLLKKIKYRSTL